MSEALSKACLVRVSIPCEMCQTVAQTQAHSKEPTYLLGENGVRKAGISAVDFQLLESSIAFCARP